MLRVSKADVIRVSSSSVVKLRLVSITVKIAFIKNKASSAHSCKDCSHIHVFIRSSNIWLSYIHSHLKLNYLTMLKTLGSNSMLNWPHDVLH